VAVGVSGGADSMALLRALVSAKDQIGGLGCVFAAHVNHGLRGRESDEDESWLRQQCDELGVSLAVRRMNNAALGRYRDVGREAAMRELRYRLLTEIAEEAGARYVAVAHTRDDQVETVLFRLMRGSGLRGLAGIRRTRMVTTSVTLVRPLLGCGRDELRTYLAQIGQPWREDSTNQDVDFARRNRIRCELLPYLREHFNADADDAILGAADLAQEAQQLIDSLAADLLQECRVGGRAGGASLRVDALAGRPQLVVVEVLRHAWRAANWPEQGMTRHSWRRLASFAVAGRGAAQLNLPGDVLASREGELLVLKRSCDPV
jgi:tRNA(Ile)-lysidine synthase